MCVSAHAHIGLCARYCTSKALVLIYNGEQIPSCSQEDQSLMRETDIIQRILLTNTQPQNGISAQNEKHMIIWKHLIKESRRMGRWVARAKTQCRRDHGRSIEVKEDLAGCQRTLVENGVFAHFYEFQSHIYVTNTYWAHIICTELARCFRFSMNKTDTIPAISDLSF